MKHLPNPPSIKTRTGLWLSLLLCTVPILSGQSAEEVKSLAAVNNAFALDLYSKVREETQGNLLFSPYSISTAFAMTYAGARGETAKQMADVFHFSQYAHSLQSGFSALNQTLQNDAGAESGYTLNVANAIWGQQNFGFLESFSNTLKTYHGAGMREVNFITDSEKIRLDVNSWVEEKTKQKIKDLIAPGKINFETRLVLANAIYFKGLWDVPFHPDNTRSKPFHVTTSEKIDVSMMGLSTLARYLVVPGQLEILELPYGSGTCSMYCLLPLEEFGMQALEQAMNNENLDRWLGNMVPTPVDVSLPKFTFESKFKLGKLLVSLGLRDAFTSQADFSGMNGRKDLFLQFAVHKAFVDVNEKGTEAAAATGIGAGVTSANPRFNANRPFLFMIRHNTSGQILFLGRVNRPIASEGGSDDNSNDLEEEDANQRDPSLFVDRLRCRMRYSTTERDTLNLVGHLNPLPDGIKFSKARVRLDIGGVQSEFVLKDGGKGRSRIAGGSFNIQVKGGIARFRATLKRGSFKAALSKHGMVNATITEETIHLPVSLNVDEFTFQRNLTLRYKAKLDAYGKAR